MGLLITLLSFALLVKLGLWQLDRAEEKRALMAQLEARQQQSLSWPLDDDDLAGYRLGIEGRWLSEHGLLLENQVLNGQVGYRWLVPFEVSAQQPWLLVDLGFVPAPMQRTELPVLPALPEYGAVEGRLTQPGTNRLAMALLPEAGITTRIQALNWPELTQWFEHPLVPAVLWLEQPSELGFERPWRPINLSPEKHQAYALQWFSLAAACLVIALIVAWRGRLQPAQRVDNLG